MPNQLLIRNFFKLTFSGPCQSSLEKVANSLLLDLIFANSKLKAWELILQIWIREFVYLYRYA
jgi:hypothetical protein